MCPAGCVPRPRAVELQWRNSHEGTSSKEGVNLTSKVVPDLNCIKLLVELLEQNLRVFVCIV